MPSAELLSTKLTNCANKRRHTAVLGAACLLFAACAGPRTVDQSAGHMTEDAAPPPAPVVRERVPEPQPLPQPPAPTYTVVVKEVPVVDLLFSLGRDAGLNLDLQADSDKTVTLNAVDRPLPEILGRIAEQAELRFTLLGSNLVIQDDVPYWHNYAVDYVNISRTAEAEVGVATQIATSGGTVGEDGGGARGDTQGNRSKTMVKNSSSNDFWASLELGLEAMVKGNRGAGQALLPQDHDPVIVNQTSGVVTVFGNQKQHMGVREFLDRILENAQRQVLIEMTIVEVKLADNYQAGVDWQRLSADQGLGSNGLSYTGALTGGDLRVPPFVSLNFNSIDDDGSSITATVRLLQQFGDTKVLSSPKIMALNNQTSLLKVVNENVYFTIEQDIREATADIPERRTYTTEIHTVPIGLVLSVMPQISNAGYVSLNVRPTISRITGFAVDPGPRLAGAEFDNLIPEIQVREIESVLQVMDGHTVILGGLMQNEHESQKDGVPGLSRIPKVGNLFSYTRDKMVKTELVIFLKPTIVSNGASPSASTKLSDYYDFTEESGPIGKIEYR